MPETTAQPPQDAVEQALRVLLAIDDAAQRERWRDVLEASGIEVLAEASASRAAVETALEHHPDIVVIDVVLAGLDGIVATRRIVEGDPSIRVVVLTDGEEDELVLLALRAGAAGFLTRDVGPVALARALRAAHDGEAVVSRRVTMRLIDALRHTRADGAGMRPVRSPLTAREWEVIDLLSQGMSTEEIAAGLVLSIETVRSHVKNVLRKLGVRSRHEAVAVAQRMRAESVPSGWR
jgi:NarL family two-component system response regulator LiaR